MRLAVKLMFCVACLTVCTATVVFGQSTAAANSCVTCHTDLEDGKLSRFRAQGRFLTAQPGSAG